MKRIFTAMILILGLFSAYTYAQMGHGMMRDTDKGMEHGEMMGKGHMMGKMMKGMMGMTHKMSEIMNNMAEMMSKDMTEERMHKMSGIMKDMCAEMAKMSEMMDKGMATEEEMKAMHDRMSKIHKKMMEMRE